METIRLKSEGGISTITLDRPEQGNAINATMVRELEQVCNQLEDESSDRFVVIRGAGRRFCAGIDLLDFPVDGKPDVRGFSRWERACRTLERLAMITVAAVHGECAGGGLQLALACDVRVAADAAFHLHEVRNGFLPGMGTFRLAKFIGLGRARRMALTGRHVNALEALNMGLVDHLCGKEDLDHMVARAIKEFGTVNRDTVLLARRLFDESFEMSYEEFVGCFLAAQHLVIQGDAFKETVRRVHDHSASNRLG